MTGFRTKINKATNKIRVTPKSNAIRRNVATPTIAYNGNVIGARMIARG